MTKTKYIFSEGIAFSEKNDIKVLQKLAAMQDTEKLAWNPVLLGAAAVIERADLEH